MSIQIFYSKYISKSYIYNININIRSSNETLQSQPTKTEMSIYYDYTEMFYSK